MILLLLRNCNFETVINCKYLICEPEGVVTPKLRTTALQTHIPFNQGRQLCTGKTHLSKLRKASQAWQLQEEPCEVWTVQSKFGRRKRGLVVEQRAEYRAGLFWLSFYVSISWWSPGELFKNRPYLGTVPAN